MMFYGRYPYTVDQKGRLFIPTDFREQIGQEFMCRIIEKPYPLIQCMSSQQLSTEYARFKARYVDILGIDIIDDEFYSSIFKLKADAQGRVIIGQEARVSAQLGDEVYVFGSGETFKIASAENYRRIKEESIKCQDRRSEAESKYHDNNLNVLAQSQVSRETIEKRQMAAQGEVPDVNPIGSGQSMNEMMQQLLKMIAANGQGGNAQ